MSKMVNTNLVVLFLGTMLLVFSFAIMPPTKLLANDTERSWLGCASQVCKYEYGLKWPNCVAPCTGVLCACYKGWIACGCTSL